MEAALRSIAEATLWMDWWTFTMRSLALKSTDDGRLVCWLLLAGAGCQLLVGKMASTLWPTSSLSEGMWFSPKLKTQCHLSHSWTSEILRF